MRLSDIEAFLPRTHLSVRRASCPPPQLRAMSKEDQRREYNEQKELENLRRVFEAIDKNRDSKLDAKELNAVLVKLGYTAKKQEIEDMIWEVDEDCDKAVNWAEFQGMYHRCREDKTGYEPRRLFNVVEFVMQDKDNSGKVSLDEAMQIIWDRYGKERFDEQLEELFGTSDLNSGKELSLSEFLHSLHATQIKQLSQKVTAKTYKPPGATTRKSRR